MAFYIYSFLQRQVIPNEGNREGHLRECLVQVKRSFNEFKASFGQLLTNNGMGALLIYFFRQRQRLNEEDGHVRHALLQVERNFSEFSATFRELLANIGMDAPSAFFIFNQFYNLY